MTGQGQKVKYRILDDEEFELKVREKILEEAKEYLASGKSDELTDLLSVALAAKRIDNIHAEIIVEGKRLKDHFTKKIFIETVTMEDDSTWAKYYQSDPERFEEVK
jgi:predicted house-cleaning noncanonical NTP pyrophosphatase (MazG superfamily)